jgi:hypothetical protein
MVANGGFERDADGDGMADDWQFAADSNVTATWARDEGFAGRFSQKLMCTSFTSRSPASHAMLCQIHTIRLTKGKWYRISFAAKQQNIAGGTVHVAISNTKSWDNCGLRESFRAGHKWKEFEFVFRATQTISDDIRLQFWYTSIGSFWLDDVRLEPSEPVRSKFTEVIPATSAVNLLPNSSFECGGSGWGSIADLPGWGGNLNTTAGEVDTTTAKSDGASCKIALTPSTLPVFHFDYFDLYRVPVKAPLLANRGWIAVEPGADYTLSAYMRGDCEDLVGVLSVHQAFGGNLGQQVRLNTKWQRHAFTFQPRAKQVFVALGLDLAASKRQAGTAWIDAVQLEKAAEATSYQPRAELEIGLETERPGNLYPYGTEATMSATAFNAGDSARSVTLRIRTTDFDDAVVHEATVSLDVPPGRRSRLPVSTGVRQKGFYRLHVQTSAPKGQGAQVVLTRPIRFAIIEPYSNADSLFGMNHGYPWPELLDLSKQIGLCWFRDWSLKWHDVEPEKGTFTFAEADFQINRVLQRRLNVLALLPFPSSNWSSRAGAEVAATDRYPASRERIAYMPRDLGAFAAYVRKTVQHYGGRLKVWEILNEPIYTSYALPRTKGYQVKDYVALLRVAHRAVKEVDPDALVIGGIAGGPTTYTEEFIEAGGLRCIDALNLHTYPGLTAPDAYEEPLRRLRQRLRAAGADKPIWFTEGAYYADDDKPSEPYHSSWLKAAASEAEAAQWQVKFNTLLLAYGAEKIIYHSGTTGSLNNESLSGIFFEWAGAPRKMLATQAAMANLLVPPVRRLEDPEGPEGVQTHGFESHGRIVIVAWGKEGTEPKEVSLAGTTWRAVDLQGNELNVQKVTLTDRPIYFVSEESPPKHLPW